MRKVWLFSRTIDLLVLVLPVWFCWLLAFSLPERVISQDIPLWFWVIIIVGIDVSHVWSTIFRTYLDKEEFRSHRRTLIAAPLLSLVGFFALASISIQLFWTVLAYLALYHFIKQQYGFMQLYRARYGWIDVKKIISDKFMIYFGMLYPVFYWHINTARNFSWFIEGDFFNLRSALTSLPFINQSTLLISNNILTATYFLVIIAWLTEEIYHHRKGALYFPWGKWLWILTTALNWFIGIVYFNSDFVFSLTNVVAHGIPYLALIFFYTERKKAQAAGKFTISSALINVIFMLMVVFILALGEEYLWDMFMYRDNENFFQQILTYPFRALETPFAQALALAFLSTPQVAHYIIDGYIWKANSKNPYIKSLLLEN